VNRAYAHTEVGLFATKIERTDIDDARTSISRRETAVVLLEGAVVGSIVHARWMAGRVGLVRSARSTRSSSQSTSSSAKVRLSG
jgi:hypothetical protein